MSELHSIHRSEVLTGKTSTTNMMQTTSCTTTTGTTFTTATKQQPTAPPAMLLSFASSILLLVLLAPSPLQQQGQTLVQCVSAWQSPPVLAASSLSRTTLATTTTTTPPYLNGRTRLVRRHLFAPPQTSPSSSNNNSTGSSTVATETTTKSRGLKLHGTTTKFAPLLPLQHSLYMYNDVLDDDTVQQDGIIDDNHDDAGVVALLAISGGASADNPVAFHGHGSALNNQAPSPRAAAATGIFARNGESSTSTSGNTATITDFTPVAFGTPPDSISAIGSTGQQQQLQQQQLPLYQLALAGSITTFFADMIMHPVDSIKTVQQANVDTPLSFAAAVAYLWATGAFFRGFLTYAVSDSVSGAIKFAVWEVWKQKTQAAADDASATAVLPAENNKAVQGALVQQQQQQPVMVPPALIMFAGAALAFVASSFTLVPGELIKQQLQMSHYDSLPHAVAGIYAQSGLAGFYAGYEAVLYRDVPYTMLELGLYEIFKKLSVSLQQTRQTLEAEGNDDTESDDDDNNNNNSINSEGATQQLSTTTTTTASSSAWDEIVAAAVTGAITAVLTTPVDATKTLMMIDPRFADASFAETFLATVREHGPLAVFAGVVARVAWIVPFTAIYLPTYDALKRVLYKRHASVVAAAAAAQQQQEASSEMLPPP